MAALLAAGNVRHDLAVDDPRRGYRLLASRDVRDDLTPIARRYLRRFRERVVVLTLQPDGRREVTRTFTRRWAWWPFAIDIETVGS